MVKGKCIVIIFIFALIGGCRSYSKFTIDDHPSVKIDSGLLGIWKAVEDTDKANFILVQSPYDMLYPAAKWYKMDTAEILESVHEHVTDTAQARKTFYSILDKREPMYYEAYDKFIATNNSSYNATYFNQHGKNPLYENWSVFPSKVNGTTFLNIAYHYLPKNADGYVVQSAYEQGFFFVRLLSISPNYDTITIATVKDTTLKRLTSSKEVRNQITKHINNPAYYSDTVHFYKVSGYHLRRDEAVKKAN